MYIFRSVLNTIFINYSGFQIGIHAKGHELIGKLFGAPNKLRVERRRRRRYETLQLLIKLQSNGKFSCELPVELITNYSRSVSYYYELCKLRLT